MGFVRARIVIAFEADLDATSGAWDNSQDWVNLATREWKMLEAHGSYDCSHTVLSVTELKKPFDDAKSKYVRPQFVPEVDSLASTIAQHCDGTFNDDPAKWNFSGIGAPAKVLKSLEPYQFALSENKYLHDVIKSNREVVRGIDVMLNGEDGAAKQASLIDLVVQIAQLKAERDALKEREKARARALHLAKKQAADFD